MKILIGILIFLAVVVGVIAIIPAFIDPAASLTRSIEINKPANVVYSFAKNYEYYKEWNAWSLSDKDAFGELSGTPGEVGSKWTWDGDTVGKGSLTIEELVPNKSIKSRLDFYAPFTGVAQDLWNFEMIDSTTTKVDWTYYGEADSYFMRYMNLGMEAMLGPSFESGLANMKAMVESMPDSVIVPMAETMMQE